MLKVDVEVFLFSKEFFNGLLKIVACLGLFLVCLGRDRCRVFTSFFLF